MPVKCLYFYSKCCNQENNPQYYTMTASLDDDCNVK